MIKHKERHLKKRPHGMSRRYGLAASMKISYAWATIAVVFFIIALYGGFLADQLYYASSQGNTVLSQVVSYPWQGALVMSILIVLTAPLLGGLFGSITTRRIIQRVQQLVEVTTHIAAGDYTLRVSISGNDEIGQLEDQFNRMAGQLAENMASREALAKENACLGERARISRELHDAISQDLFSLRMLTDGLRQALPTDSRLQPRVAAVEQTTKRMIREMRALLLELRPTPLEQQGLVTALQALAALYRDRCDVTVTTTIEEISLAARIEHALLRISQEALSNAVRHGEATVIRVSLELQKEEVALTIADNGKGFSRDEGEPHHGLGLDLMQERAHELGGSFELKTAPGHGVRIHVCLPQEEAHDSCDDC